MAGRPPLALGAWGKIGTTLLTASATGEARWQARATYRDRYTGTRAPVTVIEDTAAKAAATLQEKLSARSASGAVRGSARLSPESTITQLVAFYIEWLYTDSQLGVSSRDRYRRTAGYIAGGFHGVPGVGDRTLREMTTGVITAQVYAMVKVSVGEGKLARAVWGGLMRLALEHDAIPQNWALGAATKIANPGRPGPVALTPDEGVRLFQMLTDHRDGKRAGPKSRQGLDNIIDAMALQLATGGLRISEVTALSIHDIDWAIPVKVHVHQANIYREGSGAKLGARKWEIPGEHFIQRQTKTNDDRWVFVDDVGVEILRRRAATTRHADGLLFYSENNRGRQSPLNLANLRRTLRGVTGSSDLDWASTHTIRRSVATAVNEEHGIETASRVLNHAELSTTIRSYIARKTTSPDVRRTTEAFRSGKRTA